MLPTNPPTDSPSIPAWFKGEGPCLGCSATQPSNLPDPELHLLGVTPKVLLTLKSERAGTDIGATCALHLLEFLGSTS